MLRRWWLILGLIVVFGAAYMFFYARRPTVQGTATPVKSLQIAGADAGYVSSDICAECHKEIWETYRRTGMGRSFARVGEAAAIEDYERKNTYYHKASDRYYTMSRKDGKFYQRRHQISFDGKETNVVEKEINFI